MTYLQLCQNAHLWLRLGDGLPGTLPTTTIGQTDRLAELVEWVKRAWIDIQSAKDQWGFLVQQGTFPTIAGTRTYALSTISTAQRWLPLHVGGVRLAKIQLTSIGVGDQGYMFYVPYEQFRGVYDLGSRGTGKPGFFTIHPDQTLEVDTTPDAIYTVLLDYEAKPQEFAADADDPAAYPAAGKGLPARYHEVIVWAAMMNYCLSRGDSGPTYAMAELKYKNAFSRMCRDFLPEFGW